MSARAWINTLTAGAIVWLCLFGLDAAWQSATRGELIVLHLRSEP